MREFWVSEKQYVQAVAARKGFVHSLLSRTYLLVMTCELNAIGVFFRAHYLRSPILFSALVCLQPAELGCRESAGSDVPGRCTVAAVATSEWSP